MTNYKGYRIGSIEKSTLKMLLGLGSVQFPSDHQKSTDDTWSSIFKTYRQKIEIPSVCQKLKQKGLIKFVSKNNVLYTVLTSDGNKYIKENFFKVEKPVIKDVVWNKKWHIVIFDIPESRKKIRNLLRYNLKRIGFIQIQGSVWLFPFQCDDLIHLIKTYFKLTTEVIYIVADKIEGENKIKKRFNLK